MNLQNNMGILAAFMLYLAAMMGIGIYYSRRQKKLSQFILGDRKLGPWVTSMSAEASDMSGWMLMGLPGFAYLNGLSAFWTGFGLIVGTWANWVLTSKRLRHYTEVANNSLTIPDYLSNRFEDHKSGLRLICALFIILFFIIYTSSGFVSAGKLFNTILGLPYFIALLIGAFVVVFYTFLGGFSAVSMTDFIQGTMMFFTVIYIPVAATIVLGGPAPTMAALAEEGKDFFSFFPESLGGMSLIIMILSSLGWGLGYFGQPHILSEGLENKWYKEIQQASLPDVFEAIKSKRYLYSRLKRIAASLLLSSELVPSPFSHSSFPKYARLLALRSTKSFILNKSNLPVITGAAKALRTLQEEKALESFSIDLRATDIQSYCMKNKSYRTGRLDFYHSPVIR